MLNFAYGIRGEETTAQFGRFGKIALYLSTPKPAHVVLLAFTILNSPFWLLF